MHFEIYAARYHAMRLFDCITMHDTSSEGAHRTAEIRTIGVQPQGRHLQEAAPPFPD